ncbi:hypothetical protein [Natronoglomus mannanivorans]|uniref:Uncharacterized protein n=1 Tax=Natronoglomus mannanivorans TaxID=2979990 RepID=A0AAP2YZT7_9EURY|nr:hypothetical protein [Halobacteria archaeon AArc-xg1-1]
MIWQDLVFLAGSVFSIFCLAPTLRDMDARVPLATSLPSMTIGWVYALTFFSLGMTFSGLGSLAAGSMWSLIAVLRSPSSDGPRLTRRDELVLFVNDVRRWFGSVRSGSHVDERYVLE